MRASSFAISLVALTSARGATAAFTKGPWVQRVGPNRAIVRVEVDPPQAVSVELGPDDVDGGAPRRFASAEVRSLHSIPLTDLSPETRYLFSVQAGTTTKTASFVTAPRDAADASFRFLVYGDNRTDDAAHAAVVRAMVVVPAAFLVHTGDLVEKGGSAAQWQTFFDIEAPLLASRALYSAVGNHELTDAAGTNYTRFFGPNDPQPEIPGERTLLEHLNGTFRWGNTRFFLVNGMVSFGRSPDRAWLEKALHDADAEPDLVWRVLVSHHGLWSSGPHGNNTRMHDGAIPAILKNHKVDLVLSGHDHLYERGMGDGIAYVVSGGGGAPLYKIKHRVPESRKAESVRHFVQVDVTRDAMKLVAIRPDGSTLERCALVKSGWDCDDAPATAAANGGSAGEDGAARSTPVPPSSRCACDVVGGRAAGGGALAGIGLALLALARRRSR